MTPKEKGGRILQMIASIRETREGQEAKLARLEIWGQIMLQGIEQDDVVRGSCEEEDLKRIASIGSRRAELPEHIRRARFMLKNRQSPRTLTTRIHTVNGDTILLDPPVLGSLGRVKGREQAPVLDAEDVADLEALWDNQ
jgi:hypothetical protein